MLLRSLVLYSVDLYLESFRVFEAGVLLQIVHTEKMRLANLSDIEVDGFLPPFRSVDFIILYAG